MWDGYGAGVDAGYPTAVRRRLGRAGFGWRISVPCGLSGFVPCSVGIRRPFGGPVRGTVTACRVWFAGRIARRIGWLLAGARPFTYSLLLTAGLQPGPRDNADRGLPNGRSATLGRK